MVAETVFVRRALTTMDWLTWAHESKRRPVLLLGHAPKDEGEGALRRRDPEWYWFTHAVPMMAGYWNPLEHGAFALLGWNGVWVDGDYYIVPDERCSSDMEGLARRAVSRGMGGVRVDIEEREAVLQDLKGKGGVLEARFRWSDDPTAPLRVAARAWVAAQQKERFTSEEVARLLAGGDPLVPVSAPQGVLMGFHGPGEPCYDRRCQRGHAEGT